MQMLKKIFNSNNKYYLELDELKDSEVVQTALKTAEKATELVKEKAVEIAKSEPVQEVVKTAEEAVETAQNKLESAIATQGKPAQTKSTKATTAKGKTSKNSKVAESQAAKKEIKATPQNGASSFDPPFWVAAMKNTNSTNSNGQMAEATFAASDNLMPITTKYRRRPGGSLAKFRAMAKTAKTPRK
ncbi:MAG: hypothetical protein RLZZ535_1186 [Cyanobacteriota bacterium]|jgi:uncharacterized beta-barrel protein YwiB (DUF1934 family)